jgi:ABC-type glycerol-3-phosphate transport system substrate-binding protein
MAVSLVIPMGAPAAAQAEPATIQLWLGGVLTTATPGTPYETWVNNVIGRFKEANPGSDVEIALLPSNNDQLAAQVQAAFASGRVPDVMMLYAGSYTFAYDEGLMALNDFVDATPGFWDQMTMWDSGCTNLDCQGGQGRIIGVPVDQYTFFLWYRKDLFEQAGVEPPPADPAADPWTWDQFLAACEAFKAAGITPMIYGDRDGYTTSNMLTSNIVSYFEEDDQAAFVRGELPFTDAKFVDALQAIVGLREQGCVSADASTREQLDSANDLIAGKGAMFEGQPQFLPFFEGIRDQLGTAIIPMSGNGPFRTDTAAMAGNTWVIPQDAAHPDLAWSFITIASDETAGLEMMPMLGAPPANLAAAAQASDPIVQFVLGAIAKSKMEILDTVMSQSTALVWDRELLQAFSGAKSAEDARAALPAAAAQEGP